MVKSTSAASFRRLRGIRHVTLPLRIISQLHPLAKRHFASVRVSSKSNHLGKARRREHDYCLQIATVPITDCGSTWDDFSRTVERTSMS